MLTSTNNKIMLLIISPAKTLDFSTPKISSKTTKPVFGQQANHLMELLKEKDIAKLQQLMKISYDLAETNFERHIKWQWPHNKINSKQALLAFKGEVFRQINVEDFNEAEIIKAQNHLRIISGLYGILRPLDLIQPYRLEMGTKLKNPAGNDLYKFWDNKITQQLNKEIEKQNDNILVNLASNEYFKAIKKKEFKGNILTLNFKEYRNNSFKTIAIYAKQARGLMVRYILKNKVTEKEHIKGFNENNYSFNQALSTENNWVFTR